MAFVTEIYIEKKAEKNWNRSGGAADYLSAAAARRQIFHRPAAGGEIPAGRRGRARLGLYRPCRRIGATMSCTGTAGRTYSLERHCSETG